jgi:hypothetical protein
VRDVWETRRDQENLKEWIGDQGQEEDLEIVKTNFESKISENRFANICVNKVHYKEFIENISKATMQMDRLRERMNELLAGVIQVKEKIGEESEAKNVDERVQGDLIDMADMDILVDPTTE